MSSPLPQASPSATFVEKGNEPVNGESLVQSMATTKKRDRRFPFVFVAICVSVFTAALELVSTALRARVHSLALNVNCNIPCLDLQTIVAAALPTIIQDLKGTDFVWVGTAYALAATALLPMSGAFAEVC